MKSQNIFTGVAAVIVLTCIGLGVWNYNQSKTIVGIGTSLKSVKELALGAKAEADSALSKSKNALGIASVAYNDSKTALTQSKSALTQSDSSIAKALRALEMAKIADSLSNVANANANEAKTGYGHDMTARQANYRFAVALYLQAGYSLDSAKTLAKNFVANPKLNEESFYANCGLGVDSLGGTTLSVAGAGIDSLMISKIVNDAMVAELPNLQNYLKNYISASVEKEVKAQMNANAATGRKRGK